MTLQMHSANTEPDEPVQQDIALPMPLLPGPATYSCTVCHTALVRPGSGNITYAWNIEPYSAYFVLVYVAECQ
jgi:hypothetical protein